jgi:hypothetical protein
MKFKEIIHEQDCYVYSTEHRFCFPFTFAPFTTVGPLDGDMRQAVSFMWNRSDRHKLNALHSELCSTAGRVGLDELYQLSVLAWSPVSGLPSRQALEMLAKGAREAKNQFPLSDDLLAAVHSFAPTRPPSKEQVVMARQYFSVLT